MQDNSFSLTRLQNPEIGQQISGIVGRRVSYRPVTTDKRGPNITIGKMFPWNSSDVYVECCPERTRGRYSVNFSCKEGPVRGRLTAMLREEDVRRQIEDRVEQPLQVLTIQPVWNTRRRKEILVETSQQNWIPMDAPEALDEVVRIAAAFILAFDEYVDRAIGRAR